MVPQGPRRIVLALAAGALLLPVADAGATTFSVTRTDDPAPGACDGDCSLREAVIAANAAGGPDAVSIPAGHFRLSVPGTNEDAAATGDLDLTEDVTVTGAGARATVIDANGTDRAFDVPGGVSATISDLTMTGASIEEDGGAIENGGTLELLRVTVTGNEVKHTSNYSGGGIDSNGTLTVRDSTISRNRGYNGGGINFGGTLNVIGSTITGNHAGGPGSNGDGGAINGGATLTIVDSTIAGNQAFNGNHAGGGLFVTAATLRNTILADNTGHAQDLSTTDPDNCEGALTSEGHNLSDDASCTLTGPGDQTETPAGLAPLGDHGGPTDTHALLAGSAAIDKGAGCPAADQRGAERPVGASCDVGAFELAPPGATTGDATSVLDTSAALGGAVAPRGLGSTYRFDFGTTDAYGSSTPAQVLAGATGEQPVAAALTGLTPSTLYHYRLVADSSDGTAVGADRTFTTTAARILPPVPGPVTPADTTAPRMTVAGVRRRMRVAALRRGVRPRVTVDEPSRLAFQLLGAPRSAVLARSFNLVLATRSLRLGTGTRSVRLRPARALLGKRRRFSVRLVITATDAAGNRTTRRITIRVRR